MSRYGIILRDNGNRYDEKYDTCAVIGYDYMTQSWFINGFERHFDSAPDICLGGGFSSEFPKLADLMKKIGLLNVSMQISEKNRENIRQEAASLGETIDFSNYGFIVEMKEEEYLAFNSDQFAKEESYYHDIKGRYDTICNTDPVIKSELDKTLYDMCHLLFLSDTMEYRDYEMILIFLEKLIKIKYSRPARKLLFDVMYEEEKRRLQEDNFSQGSFGSSIPDDEIPF